MRKLFCSFLFSYLFFSALSVLAQVETSLQLMPEVWQSNRINPALLPSNGLTIGLPSVAGTFYSNQATLNDLLNEDNTQITLDRAIAVLEADNVLNTNLNVETFSVGFWKGRFHWSLHHSLKADAFFNYPKTLPQIIWQGNEPFIGQTADISHDFQVFSYNEIGIGVGTKISRHLDVGLRVKWLNGLNEVSTSQNQLEVYTDPEIYDLSLLADYNINTSSLLEYNGLQDLSNVVDIEELLREKLFTPNQGVALDLGVKLDVSEFTISASVLDLGYIGWKENVNNYRVKGTFDYTGLDIARDYFDNTLDFSSTVDSLKSILVVQESQNSYRTKLSPKFYISSWYQLRNWMFGASFFGNLQRENFFPALTVQAQTELGKNLLLGINYNTYNTSYHHVGLNGSLSLGKVQVFVITNDIIGLLSARNSNWVNFRIGMNLRFKEPKENSR